MTTAKKRIFSGIQPSGAIHLGNYLGAIKNWLKLQDEYNCIYCVVDEHAITVNYSPEEMQEQILDLAAIYLACGLDPKKCLIFVQSHVPEHTELAWLLNSVTKITDLERMTQFKEKGKKNRDNINAGLLTYPVLMAADILLYKTDLVPVGEDQMQHVELTRTIAKKFNSLYGETFILPDVHVQEDGARIMGLDDPSKKMSKSADSPMNYIAFTDEPETIKKKIMKAVTDSGKDIVFDLKKPALYNLLTIYALLTDKNEDEIETHFQGKGYADLKKELAEVVVDFIKPVQEKYLEYKKDKKLLEKVLDEGAKEAKKQAEATLKEVKQKMGLI